MTGRLSILSGRRRAPLPVGPISGPRKPWRRLLSQLLGTAGELLERLPPGRWLHRRVQRGLETVRLEVALGRGGPGLEGLTLAFLSDLHAGCFMDEDDLLRIFAATAALEPDLVCLGGDLINTRNQELLLLRRPLALLRPPLGVAAVAGNHDHFYGREIDLWRAFLRDQGVAVLTNSGKRIWKNGASLWLAGVEDLTEAAPDLPAALAGLEEGEPVLLLSHHPDFFFEAAAVGVDLTLSGHTHGGQIRFMTGLLCHTRFGYWRGLHAENGSLLHVSRGVGVTLLPIRIGAPPEITLVRLRAPRPEGSRSDG